MLKETEDIVHMQLDFLPLKTNAYIVEGNALRIDWNDVVDKSKLNYIMGNPPFVGHNLRSNAQKEDISIVFGKGETESKLDYVICWYQKAIEYMETAHSRYLRIHHCKAPSFFQNILFRHTHHRLRMKESDR
jgi:methylase of polypeptide subunit release factors